MATRYSIELDLAYDEDTVEEAIARIESEHHGKLHGEVTDAEGPGGGWPVVFWTTTDMATMVKFLRAYAGDDESAFYLALAVMTDEVPD